MGAGCYERERKGRRKKQNRLTSGTDAEENAATGAHAKAGGGKGKKGRWKAKLIEAAKAAMKAAKKAGKIANLGLAIVVMVLRVGRCRWCC